MLHRGSSACRAKVTYCWKVPQGEDAQETGLSASSIANNDQFPVVAQISICTSPFLSHRSEGIFKKKRLVVTETSGALGPEPLAGRCLTEGERGERETMKSGPGPMCSGLKIAGVMLGLGAPMQVIAQGRGDDSYQIIENDDL
jgi:hypothetical protein